MTASSAQADLTAAPGEHALASATPAPPGSPWLLAGVLLAGAAQLIIISALVSADPLAATWASLLLAIAPAPLAAAACWAPAPADKAAAAAGVVVLVAGIAGEITHIGLFFLPALIALAVGSVELWRRAA